MGFGLLFIGYLLLFDLPYWDQLVMPDMWGLLLMLWGIIRLAEYDDKFNSSKFFLLGAIAAEAVKLALSGAVIIADFGLSTPIFTADILRTLFVFAFTCKMLTAIRKLAHDVGLDTLAKHSVRNLYITVVYYVLVLIKNLKIGLFADVAGIISVAAYAGGILCIVLNASHIYSCYMKICREGEEDGPQGEDFIDRKLNSKRKAG